MTKRKRLPKQLSPKLRKVVLTGEDRCLVVQLKVAPDTDFEELEAELREVGATMRSASQASGLVSVEVKTKSLIELTKIRGVVYIDAGSPMRH